MSEGARRDPEVVRAEKFASTSQASGQSTAGQRCFFVDWEQDVEIPHHS